MPSLSSGTRPASCGRDAVRRPTVRSRPWLALSAALMVLALLVAIAGIHTLPPDEHEVLVLRTSAEMGARGDWVVPYFNGEPRLHKPPLNYWLTAALATASGVPEAVEVWHGRAVSVGAGLGIALLVLLLAERLYGERRSGILAAALTVSSAGWFAFTHDARPDLLYALCCLAGFAAFAHAVWDAQRADGYARVRPHCGWMLAMWASYAGASLSKGPHIPALLLAASGVWLVREQGGSWRALGQLCWLRGGVLASAIAVPWWVLLQDRVPAAALAGGQLGGALLRPVLEHLPDGYYLYRPLQLVVPWLALVPWGWAAALRDAVPAARAANRLLLVAVLAVVLGLSFGAQQRYYYMLPVLPLMMLLAARGVVVGAARWPHGAAGVLGLQVLLIAAAGAWLAAVAGGWPVFVAGALAGALLVLLARRAGLPQYAAATLGTAAFVAGVLATQAGGAPLWSADRLHKHALGQRVAATVPDDAPLVAYRLTPVVYVYAADRTVPLLTTPAQVGRRLEPLADGSCVFVLAARRQVGDLAPLGTLEAIAEMAASAPDRAGLYCLRAGAAPGAAAAQAPAGNRN